MRIDVHHYVHQADADQQPSWLAALTAQLTRIERKADTTMATTAETLALVGEINASIDEVALDLEDYAGRAEVPQAVHDGLVAAAARLRATASAYPRVATGPVPETPGDTPLPEDDAPLPDDAPPAPPAP